MSQQALSNTETLEIHPNIPPVGVHVIVQCDEFRCLGELDRNGVWRSAHSGAELPKVLSWEEIDKIR